MEVANFCAAMDTLIDQDAEQQAKRKGIPNAELKESPTPGPQGISTQGIPPPYPQGISTQGIPPPYSLGAPPLYTQ